MTDMTDHEMILDRLAGLISKHRWTQAKSYPKHPHQYSVREEWREPTAGEDFEWFAHVIRLYGYEEWFYRKRFTMMRIGDFKYWTMGSPLPKTRILNRRPWGSDEKDANAPKGELVTYGESAFMVIGGGNW